MCKLPFTLKQKRLSCGFGHEAISVLRLPEFPFETT